MWICSREICMCSAVQTWREIRTEACLYVFQPSPYSLVTWRFVLTISRYHGSTIHGKTLHTTTSSADTAHASRSRFDCCLGNCNGGTCFDGNKSKYFFYFHASREKFKLSLPDVGVEQDWKDDFVALAFLTGFLGPRIWQSRVALLYFCCWFSVAFGNWVRTGQSAHNLQGLECLVRFPKSFWPFSRFVALSSFAARVIIILSVDSSREQ